MKDKCFVDSNIFIYALSIEDEIKRQAAIDLLQKRTKNYETFISIQIIKEVSNICLRKLNYSVNQVNRIIDLLSKHTVLNVSIDTVKKGLELYDTYSLSFYDSLIISSALESNCKVFFSEDMNHGESIAGLQIINPFQK
ncbi:PIN domain-containing protein [Nonlabens agnitus]|uniref:PIN domain-containing protein n=1 Tax=Nonlabens agnitus TaxID=870484 RepID=A0A2S9WS42_9FLAO|nr:PIN domain-containing protein [Nonlabens agnitus]PRP66106.1 hypothetical protein BST86_02885 [Nonlabens agnitus]